MIVSGTAHRGIVPIVHGIHIVAQLHSEYYDFENRALRARNLQRQPARRHWQQPSMASSCPDWAAAGQLRVLQAATSIRRQQCELAARKALRHLSWRLETGGNTKNSWNERRPQGIIDSTNFQYGQKPRRTSNRCKHQLIAVSSFGYDTTNHLDDLHTK